MKNEKVTSQNAESVKTPIEVLIKKQEEAINEFIYKSDFCELFNAIWEIAKEWADSGDLEDQGWYGYFSYIAKYGVNYIDFGNFAWFYKTKDFYINNIDDIEEYVHDLEVYQIGEPVHTYKESYTPRYHTVSQIAVEIFSCDIVNLLYDLDLANQEIEEKETITA